MAVRKLLDYVFTQGDLYWLDHLLPDEHHREKEDHSSQLEEFNNEVTDKEVAHFNHSYTISYDFHDLRNHSLKNMSFWW
jgi:hypothetical protein